MKNFFIISIVYAQCTINLFAAESVSPLETGNVCAELYVENRTADALGMTFVFSNDNNPLDILIRCIAINPHSQLKFDPLSKRLVAISFVAFKRTSLEAITQLLKDKDISMVNTDSKIELTTACGIDSQKLNVKKYIRDLIILNNSGTQIDYALICNDQPKP